MVWGEVDEEGEVRAGASNSIQLRAISAMIENIFLLGIRKIVLTSFKNDFYAETNDIPKYHIITEVIFN